MLLEVATNSCDMQLCILCTPCIKPGSWLAELPFINLSKNRSADCCRFELNTCIDHRFRGSAEIFREFLERVLGFCCARHFLSCTPDANNKHSGNPIMKRRNRRPDNK